NVCSCSSREASVLRMRLKASSMLSSGRLLLIDERLSRWDLGCQCRGPQPSDPYLGHVATKTDDHVGLAEQGQIGGRVETGAPAHIEVSDRHRHRRERVEKGERDVVVADGMAIHLGDSLRSARTMLPARIGNGGTSLSHSDACETSL